MAKTKDPINFMRYKPLYFVISFVAILPGVISLITYGLLPSIDFTGGSLLEVRFTQESPVTEDVIRQSTGDIEISSVQPTDQGTFIIKSKTITKDESTSFQQRLASASAVLIATDSAQAASLAANLQEPLVEEIQFSTVGPTRGRELLSKTLFSVLLATIAILGYIGYRFKEVKYGITAILAMFHDTLLLVGIFSLLGRYLQVEVDTLFVTAVLTTLSFSVHDTIVVYDRVRESLARYPSAKFTDIVNKAVNETLPRSINNSMTIIFMLLALWLMGGQTIKWFVFALLMGTIAGTYSSTFTAAPLLDLWHNKITKRK